jgi:hypothetical protein
LTRRVICAYFHGLFAKTEDFIAQNLTIVVFLEAYKYGHPPAQRRYTFCNSLPIP